MAETDMKNASYDAARQEILLRMRLRDQILLTYLVVVVTLLGYALKDPEAYTIMFVIPFLALAAVSLITTHMVVADHLGEFCAKELDKCFGDVPQWDKSDTFHSYTGTSSMFRTVAHILILLVPCILALGVNYSHAFGSPFPYGPLWWFCLVCFFGIIAILYVGYQARREKYKIREWEKERGDMGEPNKTISANEK